jgi:hypothetical protein
MFRPPTIQLVTTLGFLSFATSGCAGEKPTSPTKRLTAAQCERLVKRLVNPGQPPFTEEYVLIDDYKGPSESSLRKKQKPIAAAYDELSANIEVSLPVLVTHAADKRFSYVYEVGISGVYRCATVGTACRQIITAHVDVYHQAVRKYDADGRSKSLWFGEGQTLSAWWKDRKGRSLADLQLEGIEWALRQPKPNYFSKREWATAKKSLKRLAGQIRESKKPIRVEHKVQFFSK